jgi:hypothetical protein
MSYFDHVRCHHCQAALDPDHLAAGMRCPRCGGELSLTDLFGVKDAFSEEDGPALSLDDLVGSGRNKASAEDPLRRGAPAEPASSSRPSSPRQTAAPRPARPALGVGPAAAPPGSTHLVPTSRPSDDDDQPGGTPSALELMRKMKKRR